MQAIWSRRRDREKPCCGRLFPPYGLRLVLTALSRTSLCRVARKAGQFSSARVRIIQGEHPGRCQRRLIRRMFQARRLAPKRMGRWHVNTRFEMALAGIHVPFRAQQAGCQQVEATAGSDVTPNANSSATITRTACSRSSTEIPVGCRYGRAPAYSSRILSAMFGSHADGNLRYAVRR